MSRRDALPSNPPVPRRLGRPLALLALPLAVMVLSWLAAGAWLPLGMGLSVLGFVTTMLLWFRWRLGALPGLFALVALLGLLALAPFVRASSDRLAGLEASRATVSLAELTGAEPPRIGAPLRLEGATLRRELAVEARADGHECELAPLVGEGWTEREPITVWAVCCDDPRCDRTTEASAERIEAPGDAMQQRAWARARGERGLIVSESPVFVTLEIDRGARTVLGAAQTVIPLGLAVYVVMLVLGTALAAPAPVSPAERGERED